LSLYSWDGELANNSQLAVTQFGTVFLANQLAVMDGIAVNQAKDTYQIVQMQF